MHYPLSNTTTGYSDGTGSFSPGTMLFCAGWNGTAQNFGVFRFTAPSNGNYLVETATAPCFDGSPQGDTDFHLVRNGVELFGRFLAPTERTSFTNVVVLTAGDTLDFAIGRGADDNVSASILKIIGVITPTTNTPTSITNATPVLGTEFDAARDFSLSANPNRPWSYGWQSEIGGGFTDRAT